MLHQRIKQDTFSISFEETPSKLSTELSEYMFGMLGEIFISFVTQPGKVKKRWLVTDLLPQGSKFADPNWFQSPFHAARFYDKKR